MAEDVTGYGNNSADKTERKKENKGVSNLQTPASFHYAVHFVPFLCTFEIQNWSFI